MGLPVKHSLKVQLLRRRVVLRCSCSWMKIMPRGTSEAILDAIVEHRVQHDEATGIELDGDVWPRLLTFVYAMDGET
jgi:hypothetical protein